MSDIKPSLLDTDRPGGLQRVSSRQPAVGTGKISSETNGSFNQELQKAQTESTASSALLGQAYIPSTGKGLDKGVHHRLPDGTAVTYDDIRRAIAEGRGNEDVSPYFTGQTNTQALAAYDFANGVEKVPVAAGAAVVAGGVGSTTGVDASTGRTGARSSASTRERVSMRRRRRRQPLRQRQA